jgi:hypothetical protein
MVSYTPDNRWTPQTEEDWNLALQRARNWTQAIMRGARYPGWEDPRNSLTPEQYEEHRKHHPLPGAAHAEVGQHITWQEGIERAQRRRSDVQQQPEQQRMEEL